MKLWKCTCAIIKLFLLINFYCKNITGESEDEAKDLGYQENREKRQAGKGSRRRTLPRNCAQCGLIGMKENGYCTLYDKRFNKFTAYCDFTSEPGYAWTLVASFERDIVRGEATQILKRKSLGQDAPMNENSPNWEAFRYSKQRMESIKSVSDEMRFTCSVKGPFVGLKTHNDYLRVKFSNLNPFTLNEWRGRCITVEFGSIRKFSCIKCQLFFAQRKNRHTLHVDPRYSYRMCGTRGASRGAMYSEDNFGYYAHINRRFTCSRYHYSTTQIWFGIQLLPPSSFNE